MSAKRSRFKVAANIPVRRKVTAGVASNNAEPTRQNDQEELGSTIKQNAADLSPAKDDQQRLTPSETSNPNDDIVDGVALPQALSEEVRQIPTDTPQTETDSNPAVAKESPKKLDSSPKVQNALPSLPPSSPVKSSARSRFVRPVPIAESAPRRLSVHASSASESEDDGQKRVRRFSENLNLPAPSPLPPDPTSGQSGAEDGLECARLSFLPRKKAKVSTFVRKIAEARRDFKKKFSKQKPDRSNLKMFDLLYYNPNAPPLKRELADKGVISERSQKIVEEEADDPDDPDEPDDAGVSQVDMPVPQVKIGADGEIILDEKSLVIETTDAKKNRQALENAVPIFEQGRRKSSYYTKRNRSGVKEWTPIETKCFYKALNCLGTDFALMQGLFPDRSRAELKNKFKREERSNLALVDKALSKPGFFNLQLLKDELESERQKVKEERERQCNLKRAAMRGKEAKKDETENKCMALLRNFIPQTGSEKPKRVQRPVVSRKRCFYDDSVDYFNAEAVNQPEVREGKENCDTSVNNAETEATDPLSCSDGIPARPRRRIVPPKRFGDDVTLKISSEEDETATDSSEDEPPIREKSDSSMNLSLADAEPKRKGTVYRVGRQLSNARIENRKVIREEHNSIMHEASEQKNDVETSTQEIPEEMLMSILQDQVKLGGKARVEIHPSSEEIQVVLEPSSGNMARKIFRVSTKREERVDSDSECNLVIDEEKLNVVRNEHDYGLSALEADTETVYTFPPGQPEGETIEAYADSECPPAAMETEEATYSQNSYVGFAALPEDGTQQEEPACTDIQSVQNQDFDSFPGHGAEYESTVSTPSKDHTDFSQPVSDVATTQLNYKTTGGLGYAVIESNTTAEEKRTFLAGLQPGSFVFMSTEAEDVPEKRCSMYMITENVLPNGQKEFSPMPVVLPPELFQLIVDEISA